MPASLFSCSCTETSDWVISYYIHLSVSAKKPLRVLVQSWRWSNPFRSVHLRALKIPEVLLLPECQLWPSTKIKPRTSVFVMTLMNVSQVNQWQSYTEGLQGWVIEDVIPAEKSQMLFWLSQSQGGMLMSFSLKNWRNTGREKLMTLYLCGHSKPADSLLNLTADQQDVTQNA